MKQSKQIVLILVYLIIVSSFTSVLNRKIQRKSHLSKNTGFIDDLVSSKNYDVPNYLLNEEASSNWQQLFTKIQKTLSLVAYQNQDIVQEHVKAIVEKDSEKFMLIYENINYLFLYKSALGALIERCEDYGIVVEEDKLEELIKQHEAFNKKHNSANINAARKFSDDNIINKKESHETEDKLKESLQSEKNKEFNKLMSEKNAIRQNLLVQLVVKSFDSISDYLEYYSKPTRLSILRTRKPSIKEMFKSIFKSKSISEHLTLSKLESKQITDRFGKFQFTDRMIKSHFINKYFYDFMRDFPDTTPLTKEIITKTYMIIFNQAFKFIEVVRSSPVSELMFSDKFIHNSHKNNDLFTLKALTGNLMYEGNSNSCTAMIKPGQVMKRTSILIRLVTARHCLHDIYDRDTQMHENIYFQLRASSQMEKDKEFRFQISSAFIGHQLKNVGLEDLNDAEIKAYDRSDDYAEIDVFTIPVDSADLEEKKYIYQLLGDYATRKDNEVAIANFKGYDENTEGLRADFSYSYYGSIAFEKQNFVLNISNINNKDIQAKNQKKSFIADNAYYVENKSHEKFTLKNINALPGFSGSSLVECKVQTSAIVCKHAGILSQGTYAKKEGLCLAGICKTDNFTN